MKIIQKYQCIEIWSDSGKFYKKIHNEEHPKGGIEIEICWGDFCKIKHIITENENERK